MKFRSGQIDNVSNHSVPCWFAMLLWCSSRSYCALLRCCGGAPARFCNSQSCRGEALVRFVIHSVAVVQLSLVCHFIMLLWWTSCSFLWFAMLLGCNSCSFLDLQRCCGAAPVHVHIWTHFECVQTIAFRSGNNYLAQVWMWQTHLQIGTALIVLWFAMLLWCSSCSFCDLQHCCGDAPACFVICNIAVMKLLFVL